MKTHHHLYVLSLVTINAIPAFSLEVKPTKGISLVSRRSTLENIAALTFGTGSLLSSGWFNPQIAGADVDSVKSLEIYQVIPDSGANLDPKLRRLDMDALLKRIDSTSKGGGALWLGEHHNSAADHSVQAQLLQAIHERRGRNRGPVAVGLEQVQVKFQSVLDDFSQGKLSTAEMRRRVEWDKRWMWPFEVYQPIFETARDLKMPLIALNVNSEDLELVEKGGLPGLPRDRLQQYIADVNGFAEFAGRQEFREYVDYVIRPSYDVHQALGLLQYTIAGERLDDIMPFRNFLSGRILWDEAMASAAFKWTKSNQDGLMVGLVGADHVKFHDGIPGRFERMVLSASGESNKRDFLPCISVLLNPTLIDTRPSGSVSNVEGAESSRYPDRITLQLRYLQEGVNAYDINERKLPSSTAGVLPLADYIVLGA